MNLSAAIELDDCPHRKWQSFRHKSLLILLNYLLHWTPASLKWLQETTPGGCVEHWNKLVSPPLQLRCWSQITPEPGPKYDDEYLWIGKPYLSKRGTERHTCHDDQCSHNPWSSNIHPCWTSHEILSLFLFSHVELREHVWENQSSQASRQKIRFCSNLAGRLLEVPLVFFLEIQDLASSPWMPENEFAP